MNNERLGFLGGTILDAIVGDIVCQRLEGKREGFLTNTRSKIVQREVLDKLVVEISLDKLIKYSTRSPSHNSYIYGNMPEAFTEAIYFGRGYECYKQFMQKEIIESYTDLGKLSRKEVNFKSKLIEWNQKNKMEVPFGLVEQFLDKEDDPAFQTEVRIRDILGGSSTGYSKEESQQNVAQAALKKIKGDSELMAGIQETKVQSNISTGDTPDDPEMNQAEESPQVDKITSAESIGI